ncbi:MAG: DUF5060 domain-containing protein [bacterium]
MLSNSILAMVLVISATQNAEATYPGKNWEQKAPEKVGLAKEPLQEIETLLGGRGCVIKDGYVVRSWGDQSMREDWLSSAKPVLSTLMFFAIQEGKVENVDAKISEFGWELSSKDENMTFRHLANMISGYRRPERPGEAFAYNDFAIQLYQKTLFDRVFKEDPEKVIHAPNRLGPLGFEDGIHFIEKKRRIKASVRDFSRIAWFWLNKGQWNGKQLLKREFFDEYMRPQVPRHLPHTKPGEQEDYLGIGSYGGGSDHFTKFGPGIYGFNSWFNDTGRTHPGKITWPDAPKDTFMSIGAGGNNIVIIPSLKMIIVAADANWGKLDAGNHESRINRAIRLAVDAVTGDSTTETRNSLHLYEIQGEFKKWHTVTLSFQGPDSHQSASAPNPFLDYRLQVEFRSPDSRTYNVPGFFDGDGEGNGSGNIWKVHFSPGETGDWEFTVSFRKGANIAVDLDSNAGEPCFFDGCNGSFSVRDRDEYAPGFLKWGRLEYVGKHYLKFADGPYWLKGGCDSPEDFLAYRGFADSPRATHSFAQHMRDWKASDPDWNNGADKAIIGVLNYLASQHVNSIYFLPMNIGGDGKNVWPFTGNIKPEGDPNNDNAHYAIDKLYQWEIVFDYAQRKGIFLHFVLNEAEEPNKRELDDSTLGVERRLFYRELIARFGHHLALQWNLCEEYDHGLKIAPELAKSYAEHIKTVDPYNHPISIHHAGKVEKAWEPFLGDKRFTVTSFQTRNTDIVEVWRNLSAEHGVPQVIGMDEFFPDKAKAENADRHRQEYIWPIYLSGGQLEFILDELLQTEDFRKYEFHWKYMWHARRFVQTLPFSEMIPRDDLLKNESNAGEVFVLPGKIVAVYLPHAEKSQLDLQSFPEKNFTKRWYNPRTGEFVGQIEIIEGGNEISLRSPPGDPGLDWTVLIQ